MIQKIRQWVINEFGLKVRKVVKVEGELGSKLLDQNDVEIFEGDRIRKDGLTGNVVFINGEFFFAIDNLDGCGEALNEFPSNALEIIGHAEG